MDTSSTGGDCRDLPLLHGPPHLSEHSLAGASPLCSHCPGHSGFPSFWSTLLIFICGSPPTLHTCSPFLSFSPGSSPLALDALTALARDPPLSLE